ncbi:MAG: 30S ribosomal protein S3 [Candidatus Thorarchaeota archaeon]|nr:30S ribosomal protein S3 [Candidatus Thorarchaeota archaeon]MCK5238612.1 30S ribosomal protein S3 [Candidatus Thorarchaeota archaeon]
MSAIKYFIVQNIRKLTIDEFLGHELNSAGYGGVEIRKMPMRTEVVIHASRPGVVIGRRGSKIRELTYILENEFGIENVQVEVAEIENPWLNAQVMASRLARQLERGVRFRRMAYWILRRVMRAGAIGCEIIVKGKLSSRRARYQKFKQGTIAKTGEPATVFVDESDDKAVLKAGVIGVKVRIMRPDAKLPGVIKVKKPKARKTKRPIVAAEDLESKDVATEEGVPVVDEGLEGITDLDELRELEELDGLELLDEPEVETEKPSTEEPTEEPAPEVTDSPAEDKESPAKEPEEDAAKIIDPSEDLKELDELESLDEGGE